MLESDEVTLIRLNPNVGESPVPVTEVIVHFTAKLEWDQWHAVIINPKLIIVERLEGSLS